MTSPESKFAHPLLHACRQALMITVAAVVLGLIVNALRPQGLDLLRSPEPVSPAATGPAAAGPQPIELAAALDHLNSGAAIFIDARSEYDYAAGHIATARNFQEKNMDVWMPDFFSTTSPETPLIIYCSGPRCHLAERLAKRLYGLGFTAAQILADGWNGWLASGYPTDSEAAFTAGQSLEQSADCVSEECSDGQSSTAAPDQSN